METMDSYRFTCKGGLGPYARRARHSHEEDQAQMVTTQGLERQEPKELSLFKGEGAVSKESTLSWAWMLEKQEGHGFIWKELSPVK